MVFRFQIHIPILSSSPQHAVGLCCRICFDIHILSLLLLLLMLLLLYLCKLQEHKLLCLPKGNLSHKTESYSAWICSWVLMSHKVTVCKGIQKMLVKRFYLHNHRLSYYSFPIINICSLDSLFSNFWTSLLSYIIVAECPLKNQQENSTTPITYGFCISSSLSAAAI